jgi:hypothetical protein
MKAQLHDLPAMSDVLLSTLASSAFPVWTLSVTKWRSGLATDLCRAPSWSGGAELTIGSRRSFHLSQRSAEGGTPNMVFWELAAASGPCT